MMMIVVLILAIRVFFRPLPSPEERSETPQFRLDVLMDVLSALTVVVFIISATLLARDPMLSGASQVNAPAKLFSTRLVRGTPHLGRKAPVRWGHDGLSREEGFGELHMECGPDL